MTGYSAPIIRPQPPGSSRGLAGMSQANVWTKLTAWNPDRHTVARQSAGGQLTATIATAQSLPGFCRPGSVVCLRRGSLFLLRTTISFTCRRVPRIALL